MNVWAAGAVPGGPAKADMASSGSLTLGLDKAGRIVDQDESVYPLAAPGESLLGTTFKHLIADPFQSAHFERHLDPARPPSEVSTVLTLRTAQGGDAAANVTVVPVKSSNGVHVRVTIRLALSAEGRFADRRLMWQALLEAPVSGTEDELDIDEVAPRLTRVVVPHFCNTSGMVVRENLIADDDLSATPRDGSVLLRRITVESDDRDPRWRLGFPEGELLPFPADSLYARCIASREPIIETFVRPEKGPRISRAWDQRPLVQELLTGTSILVLPLLAPRRVLGVLVCIRKAGYRRFDVGDVQIGREFAARAAALIDNARRYGRERATALALQHSLLPTGISAPPGVDVRHRYLPASKLIEVGGDWYESVALSGGRVALAVGDVAGHGVQAAVTMGRLRTAFHTLARLEVPPADMLQQLDELMHELPPHGPQFATCVCAVYDSVTGTCELASAGHLPPLLALPGSPPRFLDLPTAPPLGIGSGSFEGRAVDIPDGSVLVLYTDGLVDRHGCDIDDGLARLRDVLAAQGPAPPLDDLCEAIVTGVHTGEQRDDITVLAARLGHLPPDRHVSWTFRGENPPAEWARSLVGPALRTWGLAPLIPAAELAVSELVTDAARHTHGRIELRLVMADGLYCEVYDDSTAPSGLRRTGQDSDQGELHAVSRAVLRWGSRQAPEGKVTWCYLPVVPEPDLMPRK